MPDSFITQFWIVIAAIWGLLIGSFLNVCIFRLPRGETIVRGHSYCPSCHHSLEGMDLIPIASYLLLGRRCRYCHQPISGRYALIESWGGGYSLLAAWLWRAGGPLARPDASLLLLSEFWLHALLSLSAMVTTYLLIVWAMILYDGHRPPRLLYWLAIPGLILRWLIQPESLLFHLMAGLVVIAATRLLTRTAFGRGAASEEDRALILDIGGGLALMTLYGGASTGLAAIITGLVLLALTHVLSRKQTQVPLRFHRLTAPLMLMAASLTWLLIQL